MKYLSKIKNFLLTYFPLSLPLFAPYIDFLRFNHYGYFQTDAIILAAIIIGVGIVLTLVYNVGNWFLKLLIFSFLITLSFSYFSEIQSYGALIGVFFVAVLIFMVLHEYISQLLLIFFGVLTLGNLFLPMKVQLYTPSVQINKVHKPLANLPPIIYLILDEQEGINGFPADVPHSSEFKIKLAEFFKGYGFKVYNSAFSHYPATYNSIPNALNFTASDIDNYYLYGKKGSSLTQNLLFQMLAQKGYQIHIYQSDYINYCAMPGMNISYCYTYPAQSLSLIQNLDLSLYARFDILLESFLVQSSLVKTVLHFYQHDVMQTLLSFGWHIIRWPWSQDLVSSVLQPQTLNKIEQDIIQNPEGQVFFAHLLFPHDPFLYDADCHLRLEPDILNIQYGPLSQYNTVESREMHYTYYLEQDECAQQRLDAFFHALQQAGIYQKAIIIIHGDHGSRLALNWLNAQGSDHFTQQDFNDYFRTLYASKLPGQAAGFDNRSLDLQTLLAHDIHVITGEPTKSSKDILYVYLYPKRKGDALIRTSVSDFN